jgi:hypothetical protein
MMASVVGDRSPRVRNIWPVPGAREVEWNICSSASTGATTSWVVRAGPPPSWLNRQLQDKWARSAVAARHRRARFDVLDAASLDG